MEKAKKYLRLFNGKRELLPQLILNADYLAKVRTTREHRS